MDTFVTVMALRENFLSYSSDGLLKLFYLELSLEKTFSLDSSLDLS